MLSQKFATNNIYKLLEDCLTPSRNSIHISNYSHTGVQAVRHKGREREINVSSFASDMFSD